MEIDNWEAVADALDNAAVERSVIYLGTKNEVTGYYQQEYGKHWGRRLAEKIVEVTGKGNVENIARRFRGSRAGKDKVTARAAEEYKAVGKTLPGTVIEKPKKVSGRRARVAVKVAIRISSEKKARMRSIGVTMSSHQMSQLRHADPTGLIDAYGGINPESIMSLEFHSPVSVEYL